ncbi:MAG: hypothetical protein ACREI3_04035 [Nitrospirales bacterium]
MHPPMSLSTHPRRSAILLLVLVFLIGTPPSMPRAESESPVGLTGLDIRFDNTTYVLDLEKQSLQDNTFINGIGRDTTLIGDFVSATMSKRLLPSLEATAGIFANMPFGHDTVVSRVLPIARLTYTPHGVLIGDLLGVLGTLHTPHRQFLDGVFDNANRFVRPIEQGAQIAIESSYYQQDVFVNWQQAFHGSQLRRFDVGYAGKLRLGPVRLLGQAHWVRNGQALLKLDRPFDTRHNLVTAFGPELAFEPGRYLPVPAWWREIGVRFQWFNSLDEPNEVRGGPTVRGHGHELQAWVDLDGWRPRIGWWRGTNVLSQQGDPEYRATRFTELGLSKIIPLGPAASLEVGGQVRNMPDFITGQGSRWVNQEYFVFNWNMDSTRLPLLGDGDPPAVVDALNDRLSVHLDTLTYVYHVRFPGLAGIDGRPPAEPTFAGEYLSPVLRYTPFTRLSLSAGVFVGLPVGSTQPFQTAQPILAADWAIVPNALLIAGTLERNHPLLDAVFDDALLFRRPIEQGFQILVRHPVYRQDLYINWNQIETAIAAERFEIGYAGRLTLGVVGLNLQVLWDHQGGAQFSEARSLRPDGLRNRPTVNNFVVGVGPDLLLRPGEHWPAVSWFREIQVLAMYLEDENQPTDITQPTTRGRGYYLAAGLDLAGWRPYVTFWRGENYVTSRGDPAYVADHFTEYGLLKDVVLADGLTLRLGGLARTIRGRLTHTAYALLNWSWDANPWRGYCHRPTLLHAAEPQCGLRP